MHNYCKILFVCALILSGCGKGDLFGPSLLPLEGTITIYNYATRMNTISSNLIQSATVWNRRRLGGLDRKAIKIFLYLRPLSSTKYGEAEVGGEQIWLWISEADSLVDVLSTLFHETDHLRGKTHVNMPTIGFYEKMAWEDFLGGNNTHKNIIPSSHSGSPAIYKPRCATERIP